MNSNRLLTLKSTIMKTDVQIQQNVMDELKWQPGLSSSQIGVAVKDGVVTLAGMVDSYLKKLNAERAAKRVSGVKAVAEDIQVGATPGQGKSDTEIAAAVLNALQWNSAVQDEKIKIKVEDGIVKLEGEAEWEYQRNQAKRSVESLLGVNGVLNLITLKPRVNAEGVEQKIKAAFQRHASIDSKGIHVTVNGSKVTLSGKVRSFKEQEDAADAAWAAPGVIAVENNLSIEVPEYVYD
jgi:osmotically-inducible protein OsmY